MCSSIRDPLARMVSMAAFVISPPGIGKARPSHNGQPGQLQVAFFLSFYSDYNILELDPDYQWSLIGSSTDKYLWILSRTPHLDQNTLNQILEKARQRGYDTSRLIFPQQPES